MIRKEEILIGTKEELINYFRNELKIYTSREEAELNLYSELNSNKVVRCDTSNGKSIEDQILNVEEDRDSEFGKVYWFEVELISLNPPEVNMIIKSTFIWIQEFTTEEFQKMLLPKEKNKDDVG
jgi:hypothetical protein